MSTRHMSLRLGADTFDRLHTRSRQAGQSLSHLAKTLLEEGLRMESHPGIVFRPGPAGRRPGLAAGPDVWEVARVFKNVEARGDKAIERTAALMELTSDQVRTAVRYYAEHPEEIDEWIRQLDERAAQAEEAWRREQGILV